MSLVLSAIVAHRKAYAAFSAAIEANASDSPAVLKAGDAERAAIDALFAAPVSSLSDVAAKAAYLADEVDEVGDYLEEEGGQPLASFLQSLRVSSAAIQPDPLLEIVTRYRSQLVAFNTRTGKTDAEANAMRDTTWGAFEEGVADGTIILPSPTTLAGAAAALRCALEEDTTHAVSNKLRDVALAFLEGGAQ